MNDPVKETSPEMGLHTGVVLHAALLASVLGLTAAEFSSNDAALDHGHDGTGRSLLQTKKDCPVDFKGANYTVLTSTCKSLLYQQSLCCNALREFASPYSSYVNDPSSSCTAIMFSYISIYGKYQPGLFSSTCCDDRIVWSSGGISFIKCSGGVLDVEPGQDASFGMAGVSAPAEAVALASVVASFLLMSL